MYTGFIVVLALKLYMLMSVSPPVSDVFMYVLFCLFRRPVLMSVMLFWLPFEC